MTTPRAELGLRVEACRRDIGRATTTMLGGMGVCVALSMVLFLLVEKNTLPGKPTVYIVWGLLPLMFAFAWRFDRRLKLLHRKHQLFCPVCGKLIAKRGWGEVIQSGRCARCDAEL